MRWYDDGRRISGKKLHPSSTGLLAQNPHDTHTYMTFLYSNELCKRTAVRRTRTVHHWLNSAIHIRHIVGNTSKVAVFPAVQLVTISRICIMNGSQVNEIEFEFIILSDDFILDLFITYLFYNHRFVAGTPKLQVSISAYTYVNTCPFDLSVFEFCLLFLLDFIITY